MSDPKKAVLQNIVDSYDSESEGKNSDLYKHINNNWTNMDRLRAGFQRQADEVNNYRRETYEALSNLVIPGTSTPPMSPPELVYPIYTGEPPVLSAGVPVPSANDLDSDVDVAQLADVANVMTAAANCDDVLKQLGGSDGSSLMVEDGALQELERAATAILVLSQAISDPNQAALGDLSNTSKNGKLDLAIVALKDLIRQVKELQAFYDKYRELSEARNKELHDEMAALGGLGTSAATDWNKFYEDMAALESKVAALKAATGALGRGWAPELNEAFKEQCFIQRYAYELIQHRVKFLDSNTELPYEEGKGNGFNRPLVVQGEPFGFMNALTQPKSTKALFKLPNTILSQLQPHIRLYKVDQNNKETEITFPSKIEFGRNSQGSTLSAVEALKNSKKRGHGVGLKSFNFAFEGSDPFSVKKSITARLELFAASFEEILENRGGYSYADLALKTGTSLMEQNIQSDMNSDGVIDNLDKLKFRLKAVLGYSAPKNLHIPRDTGLGAQEINEAVYNSFVTINLTPTIHEFKFDESGRLTFTIDYLAYIEDFFDSAFFNVFSDIRVTSDVYRRKVLRKYYEKECRLDDIDQLKKEEEKKTPEELRNSLRTLIENLLITGNVRTIEVSYGAMGEFVVNPLVSMSSLVANSYTPSGEVGGVSEETKKLIKDSKTYAGAAAAAAGPQSTGFMDSLKGMFGMGGDKTNKAADAWYTPSSKPSKAGPGDANYKEQITFFYFYDLINVAMKNIETSLSDTGYIATLDKMAEVPESYIDEQKLILQKMRENYQQLRVLLGPIEVRDPVNSSHFVHASIADIPISLNYFADWMTQKVIARGRTEYNLSRFINDFVKNYLRNFMNDGTCYGGVSKQRISFFSSNVTSYKNSGDEVDEITSRIQRDRLNFGPEDLGRLNMQDETGLSVFSDCLLNTMGVRGMPNSALNFQKQINYMIFYAGRSQPRNLMTGDKYTDESAGIFHYVLGRDRGIVKNIDLKRTNTTGLKELRFEQEGFDGLQQLREVYDATINTFALPSAYPGTYIFIEPRGFAPGTRGFSSNINPDGKPVKMTQANKHELTKYGIGGYFMIIRSEHTLAEGVAESQITAKWVAGLESKATPAGDSDTEISSAFPSTTKCKSKQTSQSVSSVKAPTKPSTPADTVSTKP